jgi:hypothetical protein
LISQLDRLPPHRIGASTYRDATGHPVQPPAERIAGSDCFRPSNQDKERRLKCVLDIPLVAQDAATDAKDHGAVT